MRFLTAAGMLAARHQGVVISHSGGGWIVKKTVLRDRRSAVISAAAKLETLERRVLLHGSIEALLKLGVPESMVQDNAHIAYSDYITLGPELQRMIDPHQIEHADAPDLDQLYGLPLYMSESEALARGGGGSLPDFFPQLPSGGAPFIDTMAQTGRVLLKFGTQVNNQGAGPGSLISRNPGSSIPTGAPITSWVNPDGSQNVLQPVFSYTGNSFVLSHYRLAGKFTYHPGHGHFHYDGYASYALRHRNPDGTVGDYVERPDGTGTIGAKVGFCLLTFSGTFTTEWGANSSTLPGYNQDLNAPANCGFDQGIRVGRYDIYDSSLEGQWLDVTGVPSGQYFLEIQLDAENGMLESNEDNNTKHFAVSVSGTPNTPNIHPDMFDTNGNNDTMERATDMGVMGVFTQSGLTVHWGLDIDWFKFTAASSGTGTISTSQSSGNIDLYLHNSAGDVLVQSTLPTGTDSVSWNFVAGQEYYVRAQTYNSTRSSGYQVAWNIKPTITAQAPVPVANELSGSSAMISIARNGPTSSPLTVNFTVAGTATRGVDYNLYHDGVLVAGNSITIGNLAPQGDLEIRPIYDNTPEPAETVIVTLNSSAAYVIDGGNAVTVTIADAGPEVTGTSQVWQTSPHKLVYQVQRLDTSTLQVSDFTVINRDTNEPVIPQGVSVAQFGGAAVVTLTFDGPLPDGQYRATLNGAGIANELGDAMFGEHVYDFFVLTGDANHDGRINLADFNILAANFGQSDRDASTGDFNYDGIVNLADFNILASKFGMVLGSPSDAATAGRGTSSTLPPLGGSIRGPADGSIFSDTGIGSGSGEDERVLDQLA